MSPHDQFYIEERQWILQGDWTLQHYASLKSRIDQLSNRVKQPSALDISRIDKLDTAGASLLVRLLGNAALSKLIDDQAQVSKERRDLILAVMGSLEAEESEEPQTFNVWSIVPARIGHQISRFVEQVKLLLAFAGELIATLAMILPQPSRWRITSFVAHLHQTCLNAVPIVSLLSFLVGAVVAFLGATILDDFGATIYTVSLVAFSFLREFGVMLAAVLIAGRTASAFTAQIGSMKANEEIDAIRTLGLNPMELLVIPRVLAMVVSLPILTFVGIISGIVGGSLVCILSLDISLAQILNILKTDIAVIHFYVGISKAPVFAFVIAIIGCLEGFKTSGSAQSVGEHTTSAVVQSIFMVILLDSIAAIFFMEMGW